MAGQVENKPTAAYILSLLGGIFGLIGGLVLLSFGAILAIFTFGLSLVLGLWVMTCSIIVIVAASRLNAEPLEHSKWGAIILVFSLIGSWSILNLIGGILALVYEPRIVGAYSPQGYPQQGYPPNPPYVPQQSYPQQITRICPQCGRVVNENIKFCPHCGTQLG
jgi:hypothetical protein